MNRLFLCLIFPLTFFATAAFSQTPITVNTFQKIEEIVGNLGGEGVVITNIKCNCPEGSFDIKPAYGSFEDHANLLGLENGLILTTGSAPGARGPNNSSGFSQNNNHTSSDQDLEKLIDVTETELYDICKVEFDIIPSGSLLSFNYVFGSDEYMEYTQYNDVFGFFITGPGINGSQNLATVPGSSTVVSVSSINANKNSIYYRSNEVWNAPSANYIQYDGYTTVLKAAVKVIPCQKYHLRLTIADNKDPFLDSGVFIEEGSITSSEAAKISVFYENPSYPYAVENCNKAYVVVERNSVTDLNYDLEVTVQVNGTASQGTDFDTLPETIVLPANVISDTIIVDPYYDGIEEGLENIQVVINSTCSAFPQPTSVTIPLRDYYIYPIVNAVTCAGDSTLINKNFAADSIAWDPSPFLSCLNCLSPYASPDSNTYFPFTAYNHNSSCIARDSILVKVHHLNADFTYSTKDCMTSVDVQFDSHSSGADIYSWNFGDGQSDEKASPLHTYITRGMDDKTFQVTMTASHSELRCSKEVTKTITITKPLYVPNLITANGDGSNDDFQVQGLLGDCWTLKIFNRWGNLVYTTSEYQNSWKPVDLPPAIYFYSFENDDKSKVVKGWVQIVK